MRFLILLLMFVAGCGKKAEPETEVNSGGERNTRPLDPAPNMGGRELRVPSHHALAKAFADNPQRAKREYDSLRWRLHVRVDQINETRIIAGVVNSGDVGWATITMRSNRELEKLSRNKPAIIEACVVDFRPGVWEGVHFADGTFVEDGKNPDETPLEGTYPLTAASLKEVIDQFERGTMWGSSRYRNARWSFSGAVSKKTSQLGSSYIVEIADVGKVEVSFGGGTRVTVGNRVELDAVASRLSFGEEGKPQMVFSSPKLKK